MVDVFREEEVLRHGTQMMGTARRCVMNEAACSRSCGWMNRRHDFAKRICGITTSNDPLPDSCAFSFRIFSSCRSLTRQPRLLRTVNAHLRIPVQARACATSVSEAVPFWRLLHPWRMQPACETIHGPRFRWPHGYERYRVYATRPLRLGAPVHKQDHLPLGPPKSFE